MVPRFGVSATTRDNQDRARTGGRKMSPWGSMDHEHVAVRPGINEHDKKYIGVQGMRAEKIP